MQLIQELCILYGNVKPKLKLSFYFPINVTVTFDAMKMFHICFGRSFSLTVQVPLTIFLPVIDLMSLIILINYCL